MTVFTPKSLTKTESKSPTNRASNIHKPMKLTKVMTICGVAVALALGAMATAQEKPENKADQKPAPKPNRPPAAQIDRTAAIAKFLDLSDDQKTKIKPILDEENTAMRALREDRSLPAETRMAKLREIRETATTKVKPILNDQQFEKWLKTHPRPGARPPAAAPGAPAAPGAKPAAPAPAK